MMEKEMTKENVTDLGRLYYQMAILMKAITNMERDLDKYKIINLTTIKSIIIYIVQYIYDDFVNN